mmetsp:Transcript_15149/g.33632  ORF Transcript_15149/g.33632 Transcript_15149/m.33632 type:complete len:235 (-) Transcript_15149:707-1411(-)
MQREAQDGRNRDGRRRGCHGGTISASAAADTPAIGSAQSCRQRKRHRIRGVCHQWPDACVLSIGVSTGPALDVIPLGAHVIARASPILKRTCERTRAALLATAGKCAGPHDAAASVACSTLRGTAAGEGCTAPRRPESATLGHIGVRILARIVCLGTEAKVGGADHPDDEALRFNVRLPCPWQGRSARRLLNTCGATSGTRRAQVDDDVAVERIGMADDSFIAAATCTAAGRAS